MLSKHFYNGWGARAMRGLRKSRKLEGHRKGAPQQPTANDIPHPGFAPHLKSHITAPFSLVLFVQIARLNLLDVLDVI